MKKQVNYNHYDFEKYVWLDRFCSFWYQLKLIYERKPKSILEIWVGSWYNICFLKKDFIYKTMDIDKDLTPDFVGDISDSSDLPNEKFDIVCAFQVLEHIPFNKFEVSLQNMKKLSNKYIIISLPYKKVWLGFCIKLPLIKTIKINLSFPMFWVTHKFDWQHYWEVGAKNYSVSKIKKLLSKYWVLEEVIFPFENMYHIFFVLKINN